MGAKNHIFFSGRTFGRSTLNYVPHWSKILDSKFCPFKARIFEIISIISKKNDDNWRPRSLTHAISGANLSSGRGGSNDTILDRQIDHHQLIHRRNPTYGISY